MNRKSLRKALATVALLAVLGLSLGTVDSAWARGGWGCMNANLTPEQSAQVFDLKQKFMNDTVELRKQMMVKRTELASLWNSPNPDQNQISAKQKELWALRDQMQAKAAAFRAEAGKITPVGYGPGMGMGRGGGKGCGYCW